MLGAGVIGGCSKKETREQDWKCELSTISPRLPVSELIGVFECNWWPTRQKAAESLGQLGPKAKPAIPALTARLEDPSPHVRMAAADALHKLGDLAVSAVPALAKRLGTDPESDVRYAAAEALQVMARRNQQALRALTGALRSASSYTRFLGVYMLSKLGKRATSSVPALIVVLSDERSANRGTAIDALRAIGPAARSAIPILKRLAKQDPDTRVRDSASVALMTTFLE